MNFCDWLSSLFSLKTTKPAADLPHVIVPPKHQPTALEVKLQRVRPVLDLIGHTEGTDRGDGYNETLSYGAYTGGDVNLVSMTLDQIDKLQTQMLRHPKNKWNSSAIGRYQIVRTTLRSLRVSLKLTGKELYSASMQDRLALALLEGRGLDAFLAGRKSLPSFIDALSAEWASLPNARGKPTYAGQGVATTTAGLTEALNTVRNNFA